VNSRGGRMHPADGGSCCCENKALAWVNLGQPGVSLGQHGVNLGQPGVSLGQPPGCCENEASAWGSLAAPGTAHLRHRRASARARSGSIISAPLRGVCSPLLLRAVEKNGNGNLFKVSITGGRKSKFAFFSVGKRRYRYNGAAIGRRFR